MLTVGARKSLISALHVDQCEMAPSLNVVFRLQLRYGFGFRGLEAKVEGGCRKWA